MTKYTINKIAGKLYRDSYQNCDGYHEIYYDVEDDKISVAFLSHNSWSMDRSGMIGTMPGRITPSEALDRAQDILMEIQKESKALEVLNQ